jgi:hypothetical protein
MLQNRALPSHRKNQPLKHKPLCGTQNARALKQENQQPKQLVFSLTPRVEEDGPDSLFLSSLGNAHRAILSGHARTTRTSRVVGYKIIENPTPALQPESNSAFLSGFLRFIAVLLKVFNLGSVGRDNVIQSPHSCFIASITTPS